MMNSKESLIAYCGLNCADCFNRKGEIADMARDLRKKLREEKFDRMAPGLSKYFKDLSNYAVCYEVLGTMVRLRCRRLCREGGGNPGCKARVCCQKKNIAGCWECGEFETCVKLDFLKPIHEDEHLKNLRQIKKQGIKAFVSAQKR
jgi:hypothetical protein